MVVWYVMEACQEILSIAGNGDPTLGSWRWTSTTEEKVLEQDHSDPGKEINQGDRRRYYC